MLGTRTISNKINLYVKDSSATEFILHMISFMQEKNGFTLSQGIQSQGSRYPLGWWISHFLLL